MGILSNIVDGTGGLINNKINNLIDGTSDGLEGWAREYMQGDIESRTVDVAREALNNKLESLKNDALGAVNQVVSTGIQTAKSAALDSVFGSKSGSEFPETTDYTSYIDERKTSKGDKKDGAYNGPNLDEFYGAFSSIQRGDRRFSMLQKYMFQVDIIITTTSTDSKFEQIYTKRVDKDGSRAFKLLVSSIEIPNIIVDKPEDLLTEFGHVSLPSGTLIPDSNEFSLNILNTEDSLMEGFFVEWLGEVCADRYIYEDFPFHKASIKITFYQSNSLYKAFAYEFKDCFPVQVETQNPSHKFDFNETREVKMAFDYMLLHKYTEAPLYGNLGALAVPNAFLNQFINPVDGSIANTVKSGAKNFLI